MIRLMGCLVFYFGLQWQVLVFFLGYLIHAQPVIKEIKMNQMLQKGVIPCGIGVVIRVPETLAVTRFEVDLKVTVN